LSVAAQLRVTTHINPARGYPEPKEAAGDEYKAVRTSLDAARTAVQPRILDALRAGVGVVEVANLSGYTRESVRRLARENGIPPR
jgi:hypothetical protein